MSDDKMRLEKNSSDNSFVVLLKELLKLGFLVGTLTTVGGITLGPAGSVLGAAAAGVLRVAGVGATALENLFGNPLVNTVLTILGSLLINWGAQKIWDAVVKLAQFIKGLSKNVSKNLAITYDRSGPL